MVCKRTVRAHACQGPPDAAPRPHVFTGVPPRRALQVPREQAKSCPAQGPPHQPQAQDLE